jgi:signal peptidase I
VNQERIFVNKFVYRFTEIHRGDIVVFWYPLDHRKSFIKRVIGLPGDVVQLKGGKVYINDRLLEEPYLQREFADQESYLPVAVQEGHYYVLGDNRGSSNDSRSWGLVPQENIFGKAVFRYWPLSRLGTIE